MCDPPVWEVMLGWDLIGLGLPPSEAYRLS